jgi:predicted nucleotidyltransferase
VKPSEAIRIHRSEILKIIDNSNFSEPRIFGSVARGEDSENSDVDLLVTIKRRPTTLFDMAGLKAELEELLKIKVDLTVEKNETTYFQNIILKDAVPL